MRSRYFGAEYNVSLDVLEVTWQFAGGALRFCANFGASQAEISSEKSWRIVWASPDVQADDAKIRLPAWCGVVQRDEAR